MPRMRKEERIALAKKIAGQAPDGLVLVRFAAQNVLKIKFVDLVPTGNVVVVGGKNMQGKSSVLKAVGWLLQGMLDPTTNIIRAGQRTATIQGQLGPFKITRTFTRVPPEKSRTGREFKTTVKIEAKYGAEIQNPQRLLSQLLGHLSFDPMAFLRMEAKEQVAMVKGMATFAVDIAAIEVEQAERYALRTEKKLERNALQARLEAMKKPAEGLGVEVVDVGELAQRLSGAVSWNSEVSKVVAEKKRLVDLAVDAAMQAEAKRLQGVEMLNAAGALDGRWFVLKLEDDPSLENYRVKDLKTQAAAIEVGEAIDVEALGAQLRAAQSNNDAIRDAREYRELEAQVAAAEQEAEEVNARYKEREDERYAAMQGAELPIAGLEIGDEEMYFEGLPLAQASGAQQIRVSLAIGMAANPKMKVLRFMDGGWDMLDESSQTMVRSEIEKHGFQLWVEHVGQSPNVTVLMEDGEARGVDVVKEATA